MDFLIAFPLKLFVKWKIFQRRFEYLKNNTTFALRF
jgi:hypothetical protein